MDDATRKELEQIRKRVEAATPGPWDFHGLTMSYHVARIKDGHVHCSPRVVHATIENDVYNPDDVNHGAGGVREYKDAVFIAASRTDIPRLLTILEEQERERLEIQRALASSVLNDPTEDDEPRYSTSEMVNGIKQLIQRGDDYRAQVVKLRRDAESKGK
jgi:hypothetical protein